jgi:hypothetical protein
MQMDYRAGAMATVYLAGADDAYFADGITEEIINVLASAPGLRVAARTSCFAFKGKTEDLRDRSVRGDRLAPGRALAHLRLQRREVVVRHHTRVREMHQQISDAVLRRHTIESHARDLAAVAMDSPPRHILLAEERRAREVGE